MLHHSETISAMKPGIELTQSENSQCVSESIEVLWWKPLEHINL